ncbi:MAG: hypothetical protein R3B60_00845 [Candidatus Paceibacterota bacterium]
MINKEEIKKMADGILHPRKRKFVDNHIMHVEREWFLGVTIGLLLFILGGVWSFNSYQEYRMIDTKDSEIAIDSVIYKKELVDSVVDYFGKREEVYDNYLKKASVNGYQDLVIPIEDEFDNSIGATTTEGLPSSISVDEVEGDIDTPNMDSVIDGEILLPTNSF